MSNENLEFLHNALKYLGFGENNLLNRELDEAYAQGQDSFELETEVSFDGETRLAARLYFGRGKDAYSDRFFLNSYEAVLRYPDRPEKEARKMFNIDSGRRGVTLKQAYNLLQGRYVQRKIIDKNGETYLRWLYLEPKIPDTDGFAFLHQIKQQFDLDKALNVYNIPELRSQVLRERICSSLRRGNLHPVTVVHENGKSEDLLLYANPIHGVISNIAAATGAGRNKDNAFELNEPQETEHPGGEPIQESMLEQGSGKSRKRAHL